MRVYDEVAGLGTDVAGGSPVGGAATFGREILRVGRVAGGDAAEERVGAIDDVAVVVAAVANTAPEAWS